MVVREFHSEKLAFEQRLEGGEGISHAETGKSFLPRKEANQVQTPRRGSAQVVTVAGAEQ